MIYEDRALGLKGSDIITNTATHTGQWFSIEAVGGDAVIESMTIEDHAVNGGAGPLTNYTLTEGRVKYGKINSIKLTSGTVELMRR